MVCYQFGWDCSAGLNWSAAEFIEVHRPLASVEGNSRHLYGNLDDTSYGNCRKLRQNCSALFIKTYMLCEITFYSVMAWQKQNE